MPTRQLPARPNVAHLKHQAADLLDGQRARIPQVLQRLREFHPRMRALSDEQIAQTPLKLSDAYLAIAREYGFPSWPKLKSFVEGGDTAIIELPAHERIADSDFRRAIDFIDAGNADALREHLRHHPGLIRQRATLYGGNYFQNPTLLEFIAENPSRRGTLPKNIADVARALLDARRAARTYRRTVRLRRIAGRRDAGRDDVRRVPEHRCAARPRRRAEPRGSVCSRSRRRCAQVGAQRLRRRAAPGACTLHQAALAGHENIAELLLARGARPELRDVLYNATPADWAQHNGFVDLAARLRGVSISRDGAHRR